MAYYKRSLLEKVFLEYQKELISDVKKLKGKGDPKSQQNRNLLRYKINIIENILNIFRLERTGDFKKYNRRKPVPKYNKSLIKFNARLLSLLDTYLYDPDKLKNTLDNNLHPFKNTSLDRGEFWNL